MSNRVNKTQILVIVESPAKCAKIEEYLGPGYKCVATMGHIRSLNTLKDINMANNFTPTYTVVTDSYKLSNLEFLRRSIETSTDVILATDGDREGESISFHVCELFNLSIEKTKRIIFNEITQTSIQYAINHPTTINMSVVNAQQTRQILDLLVGFTITPVLWKYISTKSDIGISAGRCQTPALRLIYDNYLENKMSEPSKIYTVIGYFTNRNLAFTLKNTIDNSEQITHFLEESVNFSHIYSCSSPKKIVKSAPKPFTTSSILQTASNELHYSPKETMSCCQELYENGYITYMRTDCDKYSNTFIEEVNRYIINTHSEKYINSANINALKTEVKISTTNNELAHEAIRPTSVLINTIISTSINPRAIRLYHLIWRNTLESCMSDAIYNEITAELTAYNNSKFVYTSQLLSFAGWKIVSNSEKEIDTYHYLLSIKQNCELEYKSMVANETLRNLPSHYSEAYLVQLLEKHGIGRPSTFSTLIDKIQDRQYVKKMNIEGIPINCVDYTLDHDEITTKTSTRIFGNEKNKLVIQPLGIIIIEFLIKHFNALFEYKYTQKMETELDLIVSNEINRIDLCAKCYSEITELSKTLLTESKCAIKIDEIHSYIIGKHGPVIKCDDHGTITFKQVKANVDIKKLENGEYQLDDIIENQHSILLGKYQNVDLFVKKGKYGIYVMWGDNSKNMSCFGNRPLENITFVEVFEILEKDGVMNPAKSVGYLREISKNISIRRGKYGDYIFYKTPKMKAPKFLKMDGMNLDYRNCDKALVRAWVKEKYKLE